MRFARLGQFLVAGRRWVLVLGLVAVVSAGVIGSDVASKLSTGGFEDPAADSTKAAEILDEQFGAGEPNVVLLVRANSGSVDDPAVAEAGRRITEDLTATARVGDVVSYWSLGSPPPLRADDATSALILARVDGNEEETRDTVDEIRERFNFDDGVVTVGVTGRDAVFAEVGETIESDLAKAELIAFPITLILLIFVFRSVVAAILPVAVGAFAIVGTFFVLEVVAGFTTVSIFALNLTTAMGLGLAIDYSLFIISRYREEREAGHGSNDAVVRTVATAGRAVFFSGLTVAVSLSALLVFPIAFLRSFAYAGIPVVALALIGAVVLLPAVLALLGDRIDRLALPQRKRLAIEGNLWWRLANAVMRRPVAVAVGATALLLVLGIPFLRINFGFPDDRVLPAGADVRQVTDEIRDRYDSNDAGALSVVLPGADLEGDQESLDDYATELSGLPGVARVDAPTGIYIQGARVIEDPPLADRFVPDEGGGTWVSVVPSVEPVSGEGEALVTTIRSLPSAPGGEALVGGLSAQLVDDKDGIAARLPLALAIIVLATFVLLFLMFGSLLVPAKALVVNTLSLTATFGAMVWIFQDGNLSGFLDFTATGMLDTTTPVLMFCIAFGLSMDYEVFLLSRIKEEYDKTGDNTTSVAAGLARTGRIITAGALLISVVFLSFATSSVSFIKLFGVGLTLAVLMDATVVRATLVPAFMRLAGPANWWAPAPLRRLYERVGFGEAQAEQALVDLRTSDEPEPEPGSSPSAPAMAAADKEKLTMTRATTKSGAGHRPHRARRGEGELLREAILDATEDLIVRTGDADSISIRQVAQAVDRTPPSIYLHFATKDELIQAVCQRQFDTMSERFRTAIAGVDDPVEQIRRMARQYADFAMEHPEQYRLLFMSGMKTDVHELDELRLTECFGMLAAAVERALANDIFRPGDPALISLALWASVHGVASLLIAHDLAFPPLDVYLGQIVEQNLSGLLTR